MNKIKQLPPHEAQKIAAGEVVERPANAVKELIENSLDAGALEISIYCEDAGKKLIRVIDSGYGMNEEDARLCFAHHATSKISRVEDLSQLTTFGFRGEALSSIAAVSKVTLITKEHAAAQGTKVILNAGIIVSQEPIACPSGTDITITDLFYNVPARKKFLKTKETESRQIVSLFQACCISYPAVHFKLFSDDTLAFNCPPVTTIKDRVLQLWDTRMAQHLIEFYVRDEEKNIAISGLISDHQYYRYDRSCMFFFVNGRWVKSPQLAKAVCKGYLNVLPADRLPVCFLSMTLDPAKIDVNIHPRKEEVQFLNPKQLEILVQSTTKKLLEQHVSKQLGKSVAFNEPMAQPFIPRAFAPATFSTELPGSMPPGFTIPQPFAISESLQLQSSIMPVSLPEMNREDSLLSQETQYTVIGQLHKTYWLLEHRDGLLVVDQHAAHERILYERFGMRFEAVSSVSLLFPQVVELSKTECESLISNRELFKDVGIEIEQFGQSQIRVIATPVHVKDISFQEVLHSVAALLREKASLQQSELAKLLHHDMRAMMACKAAVKAGDELTNAQITQLLADLASVDNRFTCPHGRPTCWLFRKDDLEKRFKRKV